MKKSRYFPSNSPFLSAQAIHVWKIHLSDFLHHSNDLSSFLSEEERETAREKATVRETERFISIHALKRFILSIYTGVEPSTLCFERAENGKPVLSSRYGLGLAFNLSHAAEAAVLAVRRAGALGIDIEKIRTNIRVEEVVSYAFTGREREFFASLPGKDVVPRFFRLWCRKEAVIKTLGGAVAYDMDRITVPFDGSAESWIPIVIQDKHRETLLFLKDIHCFNGFLSSVCTDSSENQVQFWELEREMVTEHISQSSSTSQTISNQWSF